VVAGTQASTFLAQVTLQGRPFLLRVSTLDGDQIIFLRPQEELPAVMNQAFLYALRSSMMNQELAAGRLRDRAEALGDPALLESLSAITRGQFQLRRMIDNAALILGAADGLAASALRCFDLSALCASLIDGVAGMLPALSLSFRSPGAVPIQADPGVIKNLLMNLLSNAIRHGKNCSQISVSLLPAGRSVVLAVDDDGCGISAEELPLVFDRYRHGFDLQQLGKGAGLGLTAARLAAQMHGGALLLESRPGAGTTLRVSLRREGGNDLHGKDADEEVFCQSADLLTGLADCLPVSCFREQYLD
jgi:signal transduction histidine kinase